MGRDKLRTGGVWGATGSRAGRHNSVVLNPGRVALQGRAGVIYILLSQGVLEFQHHKMLDVLDSRLPSPSLLFPTCPSSGRLYLPGAVQRQQVLMERGLKGIRPWERTSLSPHSAIL